MRSVTCERFSCNPIPRYFKWLARTGQPLARKGPSGLTQPMTDPRTRKSPPLTPLAASLPATVPFVGPEAQERAMGRPFRTRLGANENVFGPSPKAIRAMVDATPDQWMYGDPESHDLRHALADHHGVRPENIMVGEGIDGLLGYLVRLMIGPGDRVVTSDGAYPTFNYHVAGFGGTLVKQPYSHDHEDFAGLIARAHEVGARMIYLANPDNPMGTWTPGALIANQLDAMPEGCLLVLDEAYVEFAPDGTAAPVDIDDPRVIRMRTFSKAYGMAGARVGYAMGAAGMINAFNKLRNHFGMNRAAQAGALAALRDQQYLRDTVARVAEARAEIARIAAANGLMTLPSATNFVAMDCGEDGDFARAIMERLIAHGVFVRMPFVAPQNRCIRISAGRPQDLAILAETLPLALSQARQTG